ncbi:MAG: LamG domain-containing protein, partial [Verrucomicrobiales bacterium]|nr:LamG domain-containing protein [Verrucomicrobiales bacterium]
DETDPETGEDIQDRLATLQMQVGLPDILSSDGEFTYLRSQKMDAAGKRLEMGPVSGNAAAQGAAQKGPGAHLFAPMGFLDDTYFHRAYWVYGKNFAGGHNGYYQAGKYAPAGRMLVFDDEKVYGFGREPEYLKWTTTIEHRLFAADREAPDAPAPSARKGRGAASAAAVSFPPKATLDPTGKPVAVELWVFPDGPGGVVVAHGGPENGYAIVMEKKKPKFMVRSAGKLSVVGGKVALKSGWNHVVGALAADESMRLYVNGELAASGEASGLVAGNPKQGLDVGSDSGSPVGEYAATFTFSGLVDELRVSYREVGEAEVKAHFQSPVAARGKNSEAALACSFDTPTGKDESGSGNHGTVSRVEVGKGKEGNALWFRKVKKKPGGNAIAKGSYVQPHWNMSVPMFAQAMALADDTLLVAGPPDVMDEEYSFERIMAGDESINATLEAQREALEGKRGGVLWAVSTGDGKQEEEIKLDALPVWDGMAVANGSLYVATKDGKVTRFGRGK